VDPALDELLESITEDRTHRVDAELHEVHGAGAIDDERARQDPLAQAQQHPGEVPARDPDVGRIEGEPVDAAVGVRDTTDLEFQIG
jgi:hypothetical protein